MIVGVIVTGTGLIGDTLTDTKVTVRRTMDGDFHRRGSGLIIGIDLRTGRRRDLPLMVIRFTLTIHQTGHTVDLTHHQVRRIRPKTIDQNTIHRGQMPRKAYCCLLLESCYALPYLGLWLA